MIAFLKGTLAGKTMDTAIIETGGVGFSVGMSGSSLAKLSEVGAEVQVHTYMQVREDDLSLYGFLSLEEKELFMRLISVSGVGPKVALAALSTYSPQEMITAIMAQDIAAISRISGVGKKTASRIVLELKGSLDKESLSFGEGGPSNIATMQSVQEALLSMGFSSEEASLALKGAPQDKSEAALLQYALKRLGA